MSYIGNGIEQDGGIRWDGTERWVPTAQSAFAYQATPYATWSFGTSQNWTTASAPLTLAKGAPDWSAQPGGVVGSRPPSTEWVNVTAVLSPFAAGITIPSNAEIALAIAKDSEGLSGTAVAFPLGEQRHVLPLGTGADQRVVSLSRILQLGSGPIRLWARSVSPGGNYSISSSFFQFMVSQA
jgi:hypothetical protein